MSKNDKGIKISLQEYIELRIRDLKLNFLELGGVDNWSNYGEALYPSFGDSKDYDEEARELEQIILNKYMEADKNE
ncbi:hypothetical protein [Natroniella sp. ANB-PHB2]|uniref:hypothetical protein n=1 Tax=Natroniella sp. ANB-PHB2 TaxID=3384444 RepID=UPI0038D41F74